jgi:hypothetical protein
VERRGDDARGEQRHGGAAAGRRARDPPLPRGKSGRRVGARGAEAAPSSALYDELQALKAQQQHMRDELSRQHAEMAAVAAEAKRAAAAAAAAAKVRRAG